MTRDELRRALIDWLEAQRLRYLTIANAKGIPTKVTVKEFLATVQDEARTESHQVDRSVSPFADFSDAYFDLAIETTRRRDDFTPPDILYEHYGNRCLVWSGAGISFFSGNAARDRAAEFLRLTSIKYLQQIPALDVGSPGLAEGLIDNLLELVEGTRIRLVQSVAIAGLRLSGPALNHGGVTVRELTGEEVGGLVQVRQPDWSPRRSPFAPYFPEFHSERCALIVRTEHVKTEQPRSSRLGAILLSLQLLGFDPRGSGEAASETEPGPSIAGGGSRLRLSATGEIRDFSSDDLRDVIQLAALIPDEVFSGPKSRPTIALHRFGVAVGEKFPADALIDFVTALEALLLTGRNELSYRLALYGAKYLSTDPGERQRLFADLRELYDVRSDLVHGTIGGLADPKLEALRRTARELAGRLLVKALRDGWPSAKQLDALTIA